MKDNIFRGKNGLITLFNSDNITEEKISKALKDIDSQNNTIIQNIFEKIALDTSKCNIIRQCREMIVPPNIKDIILNKKNSV